MWKLFQKFLLFASICLAANKRSFLPAYNMYTENCNYPSGKYANNREFYENCQKACQKPVYAKVHQFLIWPCAVYTHQSHIRLFTNMVQNGSQNEKTGIFQN